MHPPGSWYRWTAWPRSRRVDAAERPGHRAGWYPPRRAQPASCDEAGLAMPNLGDIDRQSLAGRHRHRHPRHRDRPRQPGHQRSSAWRSSTAGGRSSSCDGHHRPDLLQVQPGSGVGALGIVTRLTLQCVPAFNLHAVETVEPLDGLLDDFEHHMAGHDHMEFFWDPRSPSGSRQAATTARIDPRRPQQPAGRGLATRCSTRTSCSGWPTGPSVRRFPSLACRRWPGLTSGAFIERDFIDASHRVFASRRLRALLRDGVRGTRFAAVPEAVRRIGALVQSLSTRWSRSPSRCRVSAADDIPLSTGIRP